MTYLTNLIVFSTRRWPPDDAMMFTHQAEDMNMVRRVGSVEVEVQVSQAGQHEVDTRHIELTPHKLRKPHVEDP